NLKRMEWSTPLGENDVKLLEVLANRAGRAIAVAQLMRDQKMTASELEIKVVQRTTEVSATNHFLDSVIENIPNMIFVKDAKDLRFIRAATQGRKTGCRLLSFPAGLLWGPASAAHQVEGDNRNSDWWAFEQQPGHIANGDRSAVANDHYHRYREDFALLRELNQHAHRLSIEWSRLEPSPGAFDARQIPHCRDVLGELREQGIQPMLTLHPFPSPIWFPEKGGWAAKDAPHAFLPFVHRVVDQLGDLVGLWCTINEPSIYGANGWVTGEFPPGRKGDLLALYSVTSNMRKAHELAYTAIKRRWPDAMVGLSHHKLLFIPATE